jgi:hypothetical protein
MEKRMIKIRTPLGTFGKGVDGSIALNFGESGGQNCDINCRHHPARASSSGTPGGIGEDDDGPFGMCYAARLEKQRPTLRRSLDAKQSTEFATLCRIMAHAIKIRILEGECIPWIRFSAFGSVPMPNDLTKEDVEAFGELMEVIHETGARVHFPVESFAKYQEYSALAGWRVNVRLSLQSREMLTNNLTKDMHVSMTVGRKGQTRDERLAACNEARKERQEFTGRACVVCPSVVASMVKGGKVKCGECPACALNVDIIYPLHN